MTQKHTGIKALITGVVIILISVHSPAFAQEPRPESQDTTGTLPTIFIPRIGLRYEYIKPETGNYLTQGVLRGDYPLGKKFLLRADVPFVSADFSNGTDSGLGDIMLRALYLAAVKKRLSFAAGASMTLNTASAESIGTGKNVIVPMVIAAYGVSSRFWIFGILQNAVSFSGDENRKYINSVSLLPGFYYKGGWNGWLLLQPVVRADITDDGKVSMTSEFEAGQQFSRQFALALRTGMFLTGEKTEKYSFSAEVRYFFL